MVCYIIHVVVIAIDDSHRLAAENWQTFQNPSMARKATNGELYSMVQVECIDGSL